MFGFLLMNNKMKNYQTKLVLCLFLFGFISCVFGKKLPSYLTLCKRNEPDMNACVLNAVEQIRPHLKEGIPELYIPSTDPFLFPKASLDSGYSFNGSFENIKLYNIDAFKIKDIKVELEKNKLDLVVHFPLLRIDADYKIQGKLLLFHLNGQGLVTGNYSDVYATTLTSGEREIRKGKEYMIITKRDLSLKFGKTTMYFNDLFKGDQQLTKQMNLVINENMDYLLHDLYPVIHDTAAELIFSFVGRIFNRISLDTLFPNV